MADSSTITINREKRYVAIEAEGIIKAGTGIESFEFKVSGDMKIALGTLDLTTSLAGLKIEGKVAASFTAETGRKYEMFNGISYFGAQAKAKARLAHAEALLAEAKEILLQIEERTTVVESSLNMFSRSKARVQNVSVLTYL